MPTTPNHAKVARKVDLFKRVFNTEDGRAVLAEMKAFCYTGKTTAMVSPKTATVDPYATLYNEGKRTVLLHILNLCDMDTQEINRMKTMDEWEQLRDIENEIYRD